MQRGKELFAMAVQPIPKGYHRANIHLTFKDSAKAIEFYKKAFGAKELFRFPTPDGKVGHAEIKIGDAPIMLADAYPAMGYNGPKSLGGSPVSLMIYVDNVDDFAAKAVEAGLEVIKPVADQFYGDRSGFFRDPFGHMWSFATHVEDLSPDEMNERAAAMYGGG